MPSPLPSYVYGARMAARTSRLGLVLDVDLGFRHWRRGLGVQLAGPGAVAIAGALQSGDAMLVRLERYAGRYVARMATGRPAYTYAAMLLPGHDGDNVRADVDLGCDAWLMGVSVRLAGGNARELADPGGPEAVANMRAAAPPGARVLLRSLKDDKYGGRLNGRIVMPDGADLTDRLVAGGWMAPWDGRGPKPVPPWPRLAA